MDNSGWEILGFIGKALNTIGKEIDRNEPQEDASEQEKPEEVILTEDELSQMYWMSANQLRAIFGGGKRKKAVIGKDFNAYKKLKWFSSDQLEAIFGKDGE